MSRERKAVIVRLLRNLFYQSVTTLPMAGTSAPRKDNQEVDALMFKGTHTRSSLIQDNQGSVAELLFKLQTASAKELLFYNTWDPYAELEAVFTLGREQARAYVFMLFLLTWDPQVQFRGPPMLGVREANQFLSRTGHLKGCLTVGIVLAGLGGS